MIGTLPARDDIFLIAENVCTPLQFRVLELRERHGFTWNQIAAATGGHPSTIRGHHRSAIRRLAIYLEKES